MCSIAESVYYEDWLKLSECSAEQDDRSEEAGCVAGEGSSFGFSQFLCWHSRGEGSYHRRAPPVSTWSHPCRRSGHKRWVRSYVCYWGGVAQVCRREQGEAAPHGERYFEGRDQRHAWPYDKDKAEQRLTFFYSILSALQIVFLSRAVFLFREVLGIGMISLKRD